MNNQITRFLIALIASIGLAILVIFMLNTSWVMWTQDVVPTIQQVERDYQERFWPQTCNIWWKQVSLWQLLYARSVREWADDPNFITYQKNNPWAIKAPQGLYKPTHYEHQDNDPTRPVYASLYEWYMEMAHLLVRHYDCDLWYSNLARYIYGTRVVDDYIRMQVNDMRDVKAPRYSRLAWISQPVEPDTSIYDLAFNKQSQLDKAIERVNTLRYEAISLWRQCKDEWECNE